MSNESSLELNNIEDMAHQTQLITSDITMKETPTTTTTTHTVEVVVDGNKEVTDVTNTGAVLQTKQDGCPAVNNTDETTTSTTTTTTTVDSTLKAAAERVANIDMNNSRRRFYKRSPNKSCQQSAATSSSIESPVRLPRSHSVAGRLPSYAQPTVASLLRASRSIDLLDGATGSTASAPVCPRCRPRSVSPELPRSKDSSRRSATSAQHRARADAGRLTPRSFLSASSTPSRHDAKSPALIHSPGVVNSPVKATVQRRSVPESLSTSASHVPSTASTSNVAPSAAAPSTAPSSDVVKRPSSTKPATSASIHKDPCCKDTVTAESKMKPAESPASKDSGAKVQNSAKNVAKSEKDAAVKEAGKENVTKQSLGKEGVTKDSHAVTTSPATVAKQPTGVTRGTTDAGTPPRAARNNDVMSTSINSGRTNTGVAGTGRKTETTTSTKLTNGNGRTTPEAPHPARKISGATTPTPGKTTEKPPMSGNTPRKNPPTDLKEMKSETGSASPAGKKVPTSAGKSGKAVSTGEAGKAGAESNAEVKNKEHCAKSTSKQNKKEGVASPEKDAKTGSAPAAPTGSKDTEAAAAATPGTLSPDEMEYKAKLAEKRRLAREKAEKETAEQEEKQRQKKLEAEEQRLREEAEARQREEEELRAAEEFRQAEQERLRVAMEQEEKRRKEEQERLEAEKVQRQEAERVAREEAVRQEEERQQRIKKEEEEKLERKKRLESIMKRVKTDDSSPAKSEPSNGTGSAPGATDVMSQSLEDSSALSTPTTGAPSVAMTTSLITPGDAPSSVPQFKSARLQQLMAGKLAAGKTDASSPTDGNKTVVEPQNGGSASDFTDPRNACIEEPQNGNLPETQNGRPALTLDSNATEIILDVKSVDNSSILINSHILQEQDLI